VTADVELPWSRGGGQWKLVADQSLQH